MSIRLERTKDLDLIKRIITDPECYPMISDDSSPAPEDWVPPDPELVLYLVVYSDGAPCGVCMVVPHNLVLYELHTVMLPAARGQITRPAAPELFAYLGRETPCRCLMTMVADANTRAYRSAVAVGFTELGRLPQAFQSRGEYQGMTVLYRVINEE